MLHPLLQFSPRAKVKLPWTITPKIVMLYSSNALLSVLSTLLQYRSTWYSISEARLCNVSYQSCYFLPCLVTTLHFSSDEVALLLPEVLFWCQGQPGNPWFVFRGTQARNASCMHAQQEIQNSAIHQNTSMFWHFSWIQQCRAPDPPQGQNTEEHGILKSAASFNSWEKPGLQPSTTFDPNFQP